MSYFSVPLALSSSISSSRSTQLLLWFSSAFPPLNLSVDESNKIKDNNQKSWNMKNISHQPWSSACNYKWSPRYHQLDRIKYLLLWMTICSSFLLAEALSRISWSIVLAVTRRYTTTGLVWPMRWQRSWACRSAWGFWEEKKCYHTLNLHNTCTQII